MMELKRIDWKSSAKLGAVMSALGGLLIGLFYGGMLFLIMLVGTLASNNMGVAAAGLLMGSLMGLIVIVFGVAFYAAIGAVFGAIYALAYNLIASKMGGLKMEFKETRG